MKPLFTFLLLAGALVCSGAVRAEVIPDLYQVRVPVDSQSQQALTAATRSGLAELLVRISGQGEAASDEGVQAALDHAGRYLEQYRFDRGQPPAPAMVPPSQPALPPPAPWTAVLEFASEPVDTLLRNAGLPVWGPNRPVVMVWLAMDDGGGERAIVSENSHPALVAALRAQAERRGLLMRFPLLDIDDLTALSADDVWRLDGLALAAASERYRTDAVLAGRVTELSDGRWLGSWRLAVGDERTTVDTEGDTRDAYVARAVDTVAGTLASRYAVTAEDAGESTPLRLQIVGVAGFADYGGVLQYLQRLAPVRQVALLQADGDRLLLELQAEGGLSQLQRALALDNLLQPVAVGSGSTPSAPLAYRWQRPRR